MASTREVLAGLGYSALDIDALISAEVAADVPEMQRRRDKARQAKGR